MLLQVNNIETYYNRVKILKGVSFEIKEGQIVAMLGLNGAGKTTILKTISGIITPKNGEIKYRKIELNGLKADKIVKLGISHVPEGREVFSALTVEENLKMGGFLIKNKRELKSRLEFVYEYFPVLPMRCLQLAGTLSGGEQQMLAIARSLMIKPRLLLLDEPSLGLSPILVKDVFEILLKINEVNTTILIVEQNVYKALRIANYGYVLENGEIKLCGKPSMLLKNNYIKKAYLGE